MAYIYNGGVIQPTYSADGKKITGLVNPDGTSTSIGNLAMSLNWMLF